jgi:hypothetical protein
MEMFPTLAHPLANKVGWFNLNNINCGMLGAPLGFLVIIVVSLFTKAPSAEMQAFVDEIRKPRGGGRGSGQENRRGPSGPRFFVVGILAAAERRRHSCRRTPSE